MADNSGDVAVEAAVGEENGSVQQKSSEEPVNGQESVDEKPVKTPVVVTPPSDLEQKIIRQVEYYYGDLNLVRDKFLQEQIKEDDGWISLETMLKFKRLMALSGDVEVIAGAIRKSTNNLMEVSEDGSKIRRSPAKPLPDFTKDRNKDLKNRTVYAKGFPADMELDPLMEFFDQFGKSEQIYMRKDRDKQFKGSVFVTFHEETAARKFLESEGLKYGETELVKFKKEDYFRSKEAERKKQKDDRVHDKESNTDKNAEEMAAESEEEDQDIKLSITRGAILELKNIPEKVTREDLKTLLGEYATIAWQDFNMGQTEAKIRFEDEDGAKVAWEKATEAGGGKVELKENTLEGRVLEGDEEVTHWKAIRESQKQQRDRKRGQSRRGGRGGGRGGGSRRGGRGGRGGGGRGGGRGGRRRSRGKDNDSEGEDGGSPPEKVAKTE